MKTITLDGKKMTSRTAAHHYIQCRLNLPAYYGGNLDALWDLLSTQSEPVHIRLVHQRAAQTQLGSYAGSLVRVFSDAARENPRICFEISRQAPRLIGHMPSLE